jgi:general stress protein CsbA
VVKVLLTAGADVHVDNDVALRWASSNRRTNVVKVLKDHIAKEKKVKESVNEKFTQDSDPIEDMGIGLVKQIRKKIDSLQISRGVGSINLKHKKDNNNNFYYIDVNFYFGTLPYMIDLFFEKIDKKYIKSNWYISIGSLKTTIGFIIKPECENLFKKVFMNHY